MSGPRRLSAISLTVQSSSHTAVGRRRGVISQSDKHRLTCTVRAAAMASGVERCVNASHQRNSALSTDCRLPIADRRLETAEPFGLFNEVSSTRFGRRAMKGPSGADPPMLHAGLVVELFRVHLNGTAISPKFSAVPGPASNCLTAMTLLPFGPTSFPFGLLLGTLHFFVSEFPRRFFPGFSPREISPRK